MNAPAWHDAASRYAWHIADTLQVDDFLVELFNGGRSYDEHLARARYTVDGASVIIEFSEASELSKGIDSDAVRHAIQTLGADGSKIRWVTIEETRRAFKAKQST